MRLRRACVAVLSLVCLLAVNLSGLASPIAAAASSASVALVPQAAGGVTGLAIQVTSSTGVGAFALTLTPDSASDVTLWSPSCAAMVTCHVQTNSTTGVVTISGTASAAAGTTSLAYVPTTITAPVTSLVSVALAFQQLSDPSGASLGTPTATAQLQRGAVASSGGTWPAAARSLGSGDATAALQYLAGLESAGLGSGEVNPVNMASLLPNGFPQPSAPGPADAVALQQYLAGQRDTSLNLNVAVVVGNPTTAGFTMTLSPAVAGLVAGDLTLGSGQVSSLSTSDGGATYTVQGTVQAGSNSVAVNLTGYDFAQASFTVPQSTTTVAAQVYGVTASGTMTFSLSPPVLGLTAGNLTISPSVSGLTLAQGTGGSSYTVGGLTPGTAYTLTLSGTGYTFSGSPLSFTVPQTVATAVYATVYDVAADGTFTLALAPAVSTLSPSDLTFSPSVTVTTFASTDGGAQYTVGGLSPGTTYGLALNESGYTFNGGSPLTVAVPQIVATAVYAAVGNVSTTGFTISLSQAVAGLSAGDLALSGGATVTSATTSDNGVTYAVGARFPTPDTTYTLTLSASGYTFNRPSVQVPSAAITATVTSPSANGFTLTLNPALPGLGAGDLALSNNATVSSATTADNGATYTVDASFPTPGTTYTLTITASGYTFNQPAVGVPTETVNATVRSVSANSFTLALNPAVSGLSASELALSGGGTITSATTSDDGATYTVDATFPTPGAAYTLAITANGYAFTQPAVLVPVTATVNQVSTTSFTVNLNAAVPGLTVILTGASVKSSTPSADNTSYTVQVQGYLTVGATYPLNLAATGYTFTGSTSVYVPGTTVAAQVYGASSQAITMAMPDAPPGFSSGSLLLTSSGGATVSVGTLDALGNGIYSVPTTLTIGTTYSLQLTQSGYGFAEPITFSVNEPLASTRDGTSISLDFGTPMATPPAAAGFTVVENGNPDTVASITYTPGSSTLDLLMQFPIPLAGATDSISVSYSPDGLKTLAGVPWPAFTDATVPAAGPLAAALLGQSESDAAVAGALKAAGFAAGVSAQALLAAGIPATPNVASDLVSPLGASAATVADVIGPEMGGSANNLAQALYEAGFHDTNSVAQGLFATGFTMDKAFPAMQQVFPQLTDGTTGVGTALVGAGYSLLDVIADLTALSNATEEYAALPDVFPNCSSCTYYSLTGTQAEGVVGYVYGYDKSATDAANVLNDTVYYNVYGNWNYLATALTDGGHAYSMYDVALVLKTLPALSLYGNPDQLAAKALQQAWSGLPGYSALAVANSIEAAYGDNATAMEGVLENLGILDLPDIIVDLQSMGFSVDDVASAAMDYYPDQPALVSPLLEQAGYSALEVAAALEPTLQSLSDWTQSGVTSVLASYSVPNGQAVGNYSASDIATVLVDDFQATPAEVESAILGNANDTVPGLTFADTGAALQSAYGMDGLEFEQVAAAYIASQNASAAVMFQALTNGVVGSNTYCLLCVMDSVFGMTDVQAAEALHSFATANSDYYLTGVVADILQQYGLPSASSAPDTTAQLLEQAGYNLNDLATELEWSAETVAQKMQADGYPVDGVAVYLMDQLPNGTVGRYDTVASDLVLARYGSCTSAVIGAIELAFGVSGSELINTNNADYLAATDAGCASNTALDAAVAAVGTLDPDVVATQLSSQGASPSAAIATLQAVFPTQLTQPSDFAKALGQAGYAAVPAITALRAHLGLSNTDALNALANDFSPPVTYAPQQVEDMLTAGYSIADAVSALSPNDSTDPLTLAGDLPSALYSAHDAAAGDTLIQLYGPGGPLYTSLGSYATAQSEHYLIELGADLNALGTDSANAIPVLKSFLQASYYGPNAPSSIEAAQVGSLLWSNGYSLGEIGTGLEDNVLSAPSTSSLMDTLVEMTTCSDYRLYTLPGCYAQFATPPSNWSQVASSFTLSDAIQAYAATTLNQSASENCLDDPAFCYDLLDNLFGAVATAGGQYSGMTVADVFNLVVPTLLAEPFDMPQLQLGSALQNAGLSASDIATLMAPYYAKDPAGNVDASYQADQLAVVLSGTTFTESQVGDALDGVTHDIEVTSRAMLAAGYTGLQLAYFYLHKGADFQQIFNNLWYLGLSFSEALQDATTVVPQNSTISLVGSAQPWNDTNFLQFSTLFE